MKKLVSAWALAARCTVFKLLGLVAGAAVLETAAFWYVLRSTPSEQMPLLENVFRESRVQLVAAGAFALLCLVLCLAGCERGGVKTRYTLQRLQVGERPLVLLWAAHNTLCLAVFWAAQLAVAFGLCRLYTALAPAAWQHGQTVLLAFYRSGFLHSLLPLAEGSRLLCGVLLAPALGLAAACFSYYQRRGKRSVAAVALWMLTAVGFARPMGSFGMDMALMLAAVAMAAYLVYSVWWGQSDED